MRRRVSLTWGGVLLASGLFTGSLATVEAADPYRIGMGAAITGRFSGGYAPTYEAYKVYFKRVNDAGGVNGHPVEITYEDDRGQPQRARTAAQERPAN